MNDFIKAIGGQPAEKEIFVKFRQHNEPEPFTMATFELLKTDPDVEYITDGETGEILFIRD